MAPRRDPAWLKRQRQVVVDLDNGVGLVVPFADDIGWRPVKATGDELDAIVQAIEKDKYAGRAVNFDALDHLVTLTAYAVRHAQTHGRAVAPRQLCSFLWRAACYSIRQK